MDGVLFLKLKNRDNLNRDFRGSNFISNAELQRKKCLFWYQQEYF